MPNHDGISCIPKSPPRECSHVPVSTMSTEAMICIRNFTLYPTPTRSSASPTRYSIVRPAKMNSSSIPVCGMASSSSDGPERYLSPTFRAIAIRMVGKKESPPSLGTGVLCTFLPSGTSKSCFLYEMRRMFGMIIIPSTTAVTKPPARNRLLSKSRSITEPVSS